MDALVTATVHYLETQMTMILEKGSRLVVCVPITWTIWSTFTLVLLGQFILGPLIGVLSSCDQHSCNNTPLISYIV